MTQISIFSYDDGRPCIYGDFQLTDEVEDCLFLCRVHMDEYPGVAYIFTNEAYVGTVVGRGFCYTQELAACKLLAIARLLEQDYLIGLECDL
jgi:hypothetical protein